MPSVALSLWTLKRLRLPALRHQEVGRVAVDNPNADVLVWSLGSLEEPCFRNNSQLKGLTVQGWGMVRGLVIIGCRSKSGWFSGCCLTTLFRPSFGDVCVVGRLKSQAVSLSAASGRSLTCQC